jgi:HSP20 family protein
MERLQKEMNRLLDHYAAGHESTAPAGVFPLLNISEDMDSLYVRAELPGVKPEDIEITTHENKLTIKGERRIPAEGEKISYHRREREAGTFKRITTLPTQVDSHRVTATCKDGVLTLTLPKAPEVKPRQIKVKSDGNT